MSHRRFKGRIIAGVGRGLTRAEVRLEAGNRVTKGLDRPNTAAGRLRTQANSLPTDRLNRAKPPAAP